MMIILKIILFIEVISSQSLEFQPSYIYQLVKGSLTDSWKFKFKVYFTHFKGVILHCVDSNKNKFEIKVKQNYIQLKYNQISNDISLQKLCGCHLCYNRTITFDVKQVNYLIYVNCNEYNFLSLPMTEIKYKDKDKILNLFPTIFKNIFGVMYIIIGNIEPYYADWNSSVFSFRDQIMGCLEFFYYNEKMINFIKNGSKINPFCNSKCYDNTCNGGQCIERIEDNILCECAFTALNGPYCNKSMMTYVEGGSNSYGTLKNASQVYLKMTWKQKFYKNICLLEFAGKSEVTIWINGSHLLLDFTVISDINIRVINFISVNITDNDLTVKSKNKEIKINFQFDESTMINVGMKKSKGYCEVFEGKYDLNFNLSQLRQKEVKFSTVIISKLTTENNHELSKLVMVLIASSSGIILLIFIAIILTIIVWKKKIRNFKTAYSVKVIDIQEQMNITSNDMNKDVYDTLDYSKMYDINRKSEGINDGYLEPNNQELESEPPPVAQRNLYEI